MDPSVNNSPSHNIARKSSLSPSYPNSTMANSSSFNKKSRGGPSDLRFAMAGIMLFSLVTLAVMIHLISIVTSPDLNDAIGEATMLRQNNVAVVLPDIDYNVDETCTKLPTIRQSGSYFLDDKIQAGSSPENISPPIKIGSYYAEKVPYHMATDAANFHLIKDLLKDKEGGVALDFGANQGFYTYYLATLGMDVHSFEINEPNFKALQHGAEFNSKEVADRVHLYPVGVGDKNARFGMQGNNYEGFLKAGKNGPILGVSFDCFAHHMKGSLDLSNVAFVKLDVEGFEIAVLKGAQNSLFKKGHSKIGGMIVEVGPDRWGRASIDFLTGAEEMRKLSTHFQKSHVLIRVEGGFTKSCPLSLADGLSDKNPTTFDGNSMFTVKLEEWVPLLKKMEENHYDCNFFYKN